ncbi:MAG TPA: amino acid racemase [Pyrinomonadaceae bacterium]|nr:amino acid racemase [Pyrinomonadaceae bacterium]
MNEDKSVLGVVGGLGPLASAEFLRTIYEYSLGDLEQESPSVIVYSDPTFPDRTDAFLAGKSDPVLAQLIDVIERLLQAGATDVVFCCMTIHYLLPRLPARLRERVISLPDIIFEELAHTWKRHLLISSSGTRKLGLFENHERWSMAQPYIVVPDEEDQNTIHRDLIYPIKKNPDVSTLFPLLKMMLSRYGVDSFIAGCSEVHLLAKHFLRSGDHSAEYGCIDPLATVARDWAQKGAALTVA